MSRPPGVPPGRRDYCHPKNYHGLPNSLFRNRGDGRFEEIGFAAGVGYVDTAQPLSGMGADARDVNDDGLPDIFMTALASETMPLFRNLGGNEFLEVTARSGIAAISATGASPT